MQWCDFRQDTGLPSSVVRFQRNSLHSGDGNGSGEGELRLAVVKCRRTSAIRHPSGEKKQREGMLGFSYGEVFLLLGATAAVIGPKDLPIIARTIGRLAGRAIGYVQLARGQFDNIMQQNQARQVHKELQDTMSQLEAIRYEIRTISFMNPGPLTRRLVDNIDQTSVSSDNAELPKPDATQQPDIENRPTISDAKNFMSATSGFSDMHNQATAYAKLAESAALNSGLTKSSEAIDELTDESGLMVLPVSAESSGLLPDCKDNAEGSDIVLEAILEAEVARNAKEFFVQHQNQLKNE